MKGHQPKTDHKNPTGVPPDTGTGVQLPLPPEFKVQTRDGQGQLRFFDTVAQAFHAADEDSSVWKISFGVPTGERVRLVRNDAGDFVYQDIMTEIQKQRGLL